MTPTWTPAPRTEGALIIDRAEAVPQPVRGRTLRLRYLSLAAAPVLELRLYSVAQVALLRQELPGPLQAGWNEAVLELPPLARGLYYAQLRLKQDGRESPPRLLRVVLLP